MKTPGLQAAMVLAGLWLAVAGCASQRSAKDPRQVTPADFAGTPTRPAATQPVAAPDPPAPPSVRLAAAGPTDQDKPDQPADEMTEQEAREVESALAKLPRPVVIATPPPATQSSDTGYVLDGMVGQINGQAIYATTVFEGTAEEPIAPALAAIGSRESRRAFRVNPDVRRLIQKRLYSMVTSALVLGEAERDLSEGEQMGLQNILREKREEFLRQYGMGSLAVADQTLMEKRNKTLEQLMTETRQTIVVRRYMGQKFFPKINVTRKDIERYYNDHPEKYNPPPGRTIRRIRISLNKPVAAGRIDKALAAGTPFAEVALDRDNDYRKDGGQMEDDGSLIQPINDALAKLKPGEHSPRFTLGDSYWWVFLESINEGKSQPLPQVQRAIEQQLKLDRFSMLQARYHQKLLAEGSYNPLEQMADALLEIATNRYALAE